MIVDTPYGEFEVKDITRKERRAFYKKCKVVYSTKKDMEGLDNLGDEFILLAFEDDKKADKALKGLTVLQEDEVINAIIGAYMGIDLGNSTGD